MRNITENLWNSTPGSNLYCVWVPVEYEGRSQLTAVWIDRAMTAFTSDGTGTAATCFAGNQEGQDEEVDLLAGEHLPFAPSPRS